MGGGGGGAECRSYRLQIDIEILIQVVVYRVLTLILTAFLHEQEPPVCGGDTCPTVGNSSIYTVERFIASAAAVSDAIGAELRRTCLACPVVPRFSTALSLV